MIIKRLLVGAVCSLILSTNVFAEEYDYPHTGSKLVPLSYSCHSPGLIALTFDDGPSDNFPQILDTLSDNNTPATFFLLGYKLNKAHHLQRALQAVEAGHQIENHGWDHTPFPSLSEDEVSEQINKTNQIFWDKLGVVSRFVRAPHGKIDAKRAIRVWDQNQGVASWNVDPLDYKTGPLWTPQRVLNNVKAALDGASPSKDSAIIVLHDFSDNTTEVLDSMIKMIKSYGYELVTLNDCIDRNRPYYRF